MARRRHVVVVVRMYRSRLMMRSMMLQMRHVVRVLRRVHLHMSVMISVVAKNTDCRAIGGVGWHVSVGREVDRGVGSGIEARVLGVNEAAATTVWARPCLNPRATGLRLVLGMAHDWAQFVRSVRKLTFGAVAARARLVPRSAQFRLVAVLVAELVLNIVMSLAV